MSNELLKNNHNFQEFMNARDKGAKFLLEKQNLDGSYPDHQKGAGTYWGIPLALMSTGYNLQAKKLFDWIRENSVFSNGDIGKTPESDRGYNYPYEKAWLIESAHRFGQFDISNIGMNFLRKFWDKETGGFFSATGPESLYNKSDVKMDLWVTSGCARAALYMGQLDIAIGAANWMENLMKLQPNYPDQLYTVFTKSKGLITNSDDLVDDVDDKFKFGENFRYILNKNSKVDQSFFHPGIAGGFLSLLYMATSEVKWLNLSKKYMLLAETANDFLFSTLRAGKTGWCAALLYSISGEEKYYKMAFRIAQNIIKLQSKNGSWSGVIKKEKEPSLNLTAEMVIWLNEIYQIMKRDES